MAAIEHKEKTMTPFQSCEDVVEAWAEQHKHQTAF